MEIYEMLELNECPKCGGTGYLEDEGTNGVYISCIDCDAHTVVIDFKTPEDKLEAVVSAVCCMGVAGEIGYSYLLPHEGNSTYRNRIIDAVYHMKSEELEKGACYEIK